MFKSYSHRPKIAVQNSYYATDVAKLYNFPEGTGNGQTVAFIELGGGYTLGDLQQYAAKLQLPPINITAVGVDGATNNPSDPSGASDEVVLDIEVAYAIASQAAFRVYFAPNTDQGFLDAIKQAIVDKVDIISISWGGPEDQWSSQSISDFETVFKQAANAGITVLVAAGDAGADDDPNTTTPTVDYPASSQWVTACGGSQIVSTGENVWNNLAQNEGGGGGGMSSLFVRPSWQTRDGIDKVNRCIPDITGNASPLTGYNIFINSSWQVVGGTSAVAPLYAGLFARVNHLLGKNVGYANPILYSMNNRSFYDITQGNNGWWVANVAYDLTSGLGRLEGTNLLADIQWAIQHQQSGGNA